MKKTSRIILITSIIIAVLSTIILSIVRVAKSRQMIEGIETSGIETTSKVMDLISIYVTGEVMSPGIIEIEKGGTILDAVTKCGGFTKAASGNINLVYILEKNVTLIIKSNKEGGGAEVLTGSGDATVVDDESGLIGGKININQADAIALGLLPGIGEKTAMDIINFRNRNGSFKTIEDIMNVPGIKGSKFSKIKEYICVE